MLQWLGLHAFTEGPGSIPGQWSKIPQDVWQKKSKKGGRENENFKSENNERKWNQKILLSGFNLSF